MVERVTGHDSGAIHESLLAQRSQNVEDVNRKAADETANVKSLNPFNDTATVSSQAKKLYEAEKYARLAQRIADPFDADKVARLQEMVQHGRISELLNKYDDGDLADSLINSPAQAFLR